MPRLYRDELLKLDKMMEQGFGNRAIAKELGCSPTTVADRRKKLIVVAKGNRVVLPKKERPAPKYRRGPYNRKRK